MSAASEVVVAQQRVQIALDLDGRDVSGLTPDNSEAFVEQHADHALDEAVGARGGAPGGAVFDVRACEPSNAKGGGRTWRIGASRSSRACSVDPDHRRCDATDGWTGIACEGLGWQKGCGLDLHLWPPAMS